MAALRNFNGLAPWRNTGNSLQSVNLIMPRRPLPRFESAPIPVCFPRQSQCGTGNQRHIILIAGLRVWPFADRTAVCVKLVRSYHSVLRLNKSSPMFVAILRISPCHRDNYIFGCKRSSGSFISGQFDTNFKHCTRHSRVIISAKFLLSLQSCPNLLLVP